MDIRHPFFLGLILLQIFLYYNCVRDYTSTILSYVKMVLHLMVQYHSFHNPNILGLSMIYNDIFAEMLSVEGNPVRNKWLSCKINTEAEDVLLSLYYSDYYDVDENQSSSLKAYSTEGSLTVENDAVADIQVFDMLGRLVAQQNRVMQCQFHLKPGVYVVKADNASVKAVVK